MNGKKILTRADQDKLEDISREYGEKVLKVLLAEKKIDSYIMMPRMWVYDAEIFKKGEKGIVEIKKVSKRVNQYPTVLMEYKKYYEMRTFPADGYYYISIYTDDVASIYRCDNIETDPQITSQVLSCPHPLTGKPIENRDKLCFRIPTHINNIKI
jgi:hypothetical protein